MRDVPLDRVPGHRGRVCFRTAENTVYTEAFSVGWPDAPHRVLRSAVEAAQACPEGEIIATWVHPITGERYPRPRLHVGTADTDLTGAIDAMPPLGLSADPHRIHACWYAKVAALRAFRCHIVTAEMRRAAKDQELQDAPPQWAGSGLSLACIRHQGFPSEHVAFADPVVKRALLDGEHEAVVLIR